MGFEIMTFELVISKHNKIIISRIAVFGTYIRSVLEPFFFFPVISLVPRKLGNFMSSQVFCFCYSLFLAAEEAKLQPVTYPKVEAASLKNVLKCTNHKNLVQNSRNL